MSTATPAVSPNFTSGGRFGQSFTSSYRVTVAEAATASRPPLNSNVPISTKPAATKVRGIPIILTSNTLETKPSCRNFAHVYFKTLFHNSVSNVLIDLPIFHYEYHSADRCDVF